MPEVESITQNLTGELFSENNVDELSDVLARWANKPRTDYERQACINVIEEYYTPNKQKEFIEGALNANS